MSNKLIDLNALSEYKDYSDLKYQDKLTAGKGITISGNTISATAPTYNGSAGGGGSASVPNSTTTVVRTITLQPGTYIIQYTCQFNSNATGYRQCGFSPNNNLDALGSAYRDSRAAVSGTDTQTMVVGIVEVSATDYPNGRTFNMLAKQNSGSSRKVYPRCYCIKVL